MIVANNRRGAFRVLQARVVTFPYLVDWLFATGLPCYVVQQSFLPFGEAPYLDPLTNSRSFYRFRECSGKFRVPVPRVTCSGCSRGIKAPGVWCSSQQVPPSNKLSMALRLFHSEPFFSLRQFNRIFDDALRGRATPALWAMNGSEPAAFMPRQVQQLMTTAFGTADLLTLS